MLAVDATAMEAAQAKLAQQEIDVVRLGYSDLIGAERGRDILVRRFARTVGSGVAFCRSVFGTSPMGDVVDIEGGLSDGLPDMLALPDLATLHAVPWEPGVAHAIADVYNPDGTPAEESPRNVLRRVIDRFAALDLRPMVGPELEFYVLDPAPEAPQGWRRYGEGTGNVYTAGLKGDPENTLLAALRRLDAYGLDVVAANHEFASGQFEINLWHSDALNAADRAFRFKTAVQELTRMQGKLATFMAKPFNDEGGSGFHLHLSAWSPDGSAAFDDPDAPDGLSETARSAIAGVLAHAPALAALLNPTINSYKRFGPDTLAPWLIDWGLDNRSAMVRIPPERGGSTRMELRLGDASANPYLGIGAVLAAAYLGIRDKLDPPAKLEGYGYDVSKADRLPGDLTTALAALEADTDLAEILGPRFVTTFLAYKRNELERFSQWVTDWEFREYSYHL
ncbi:glutamine synthetase family protein [Paractinoplanes rishiriensis]|uniref:Type I glutamate--ammonia ligase n=1 Tax=Paractinoplanes rishiriensis TaxID=1050105 RepID=A0A919JW17_9ACTN|nr:glutamine synthetase family protein [Actinoplanes rishiriensis]GIE94188.1 type I glutamate--ammonia ligase [Actinoplanes rishiriensis]